MTAAGNTCEHGWTWGQCCPKPWPSMDRCVCGHTRMVHEPHCVVTYYAPKRACPDNCREFVPNPEATDD